MNRSLRSRILPAALLLPLFIACGPLDAEVSSSGVPASELGAELTTFSGKISTSSHWREHAFSVAAPGVLTVTLGWDSGSNLNLFLYSNGQLLAQSAGSTKPEKITFQLPAAGTYVLGISCKSGSAKYTLGVGFVADYKDQVFNGELSATGISWRVHGFAAAANVRVDATLDWANPAADLNVYLRDTAGETMAYANGSAKPEVAADVTYGAGNYEVGIKAKTGASAYTLTVRVWAPGKGGAVPPKPQPTVDAGTPVVDAGTVKPDAGTVKPDAGTVVVDAGTATKSYPGKPSAGKLYWGAGIGGNADPVRHEGPTGKALSIRRTFWRWDQRTTNLVTTAKGDLAAGRLPWVSAKTPSWTDMGNGLHDAEIDGMLKALEALGGPVWLTLHHEPEGGGGVNTPDDPGGPSAHIAMNRRVRARMTALGTKNIALAPILMSWTFTAASGRNIEEWWAPGIYDFFGVDHYTESSTVGLDNDTWTLIRTWAAKKGTDVAVGEWGMRGTDAAAGNRVRAWYEAAAKSSTDGKGARVVGLCAFDSELNAPNGSWELVGGQLEAFQEKMGDARTQLFRNL